MENKYLDLINSIRYKEIKGMTDQKADFLIGQWLNLKISVTQKKNLRAIKKAQQELDKFFHQKALAKAYEENPDALKEAFYEALLDSAKLYQEACRTDHHYGSKLFNLMKMKPEEVAEKAGREVYELLVPALLQMDKVFWRNQMLTAIHLAYQEVFAETANKAELYFTDREEYNQFDQIINQTVIDKGVF